MESFSLTTARLVLKSTTPEIAAADLHDANEFSRLLGADVADDWPPPPNDENSQQYTLHYVTENPDAAGWATWYFLLSRDGRLRAIGIGGFKGKPSADGMVEVGYSIMPEYQERGYASEAVARLVEWAFSHAEVELVTAETLPELVKSIRVLEKNSFRFLGEGSEAGIVRYGRNRA
jgi:RimJ/RimL family protein N-acetyltransferase